MLVPSVAYGGKMDNFLSLWVMVFITICFKAEHVVQVFILFSMWVAPGDNDLNLGIKLGDSVLRSVEFTGHSGPSL